jgi:hypothetical protein
MLLFAFLFALRLTPDAPDTPLKQPQIAVKGGAVAMTYGAGNAIFFSKSDAAGASFSKPVKVAEVHGYLALGNHRGPRVAIAGDAVIVSAIVGKVRGKDGDLMAWRSTDGGKTWSRGVQVSSVPAAAREGLHGMAAGPNGQVWMVWLDLREGAMRLFGALSKDAGKTWGPNRQIYASADGHICECCHPTAYVGPNGELYAMWRNWLRGSRDMYYAVSRDGGATWQERKLGEGIWPLNACPMDGGGLGFDGSGRLYSSWRRDSTVYLTSDGGKEVALGGGKNPTIAVTKAGPYVAWQEGMSLKVKTPGSSKAAVLGSGAFPVLAADGDSVFAAWEHHGVIEVERVRQ